MSGHRVSLPRIWLPSVLTTLRRPPVIFFAAIVLGIAVNRKWPLPFASPTLWPLGAAIVMAATSLFVLSCLEFRAAGTSVQRHKPTTAIVRTGPYRFSRNPIYLSFILLVIGLSIWMNDLWLLLTLVPPVVYSSAVVIPREERFLERTFPEYSSYRAAVRRWMYALTALPMSGGVNAGSRRRRMSRADSSTGFLRCGWREP